MFHRPPELSQLDLRRLVDAQLEHPWTAQESELLAGDWFLRLAEIPQLQMAYFATFPRAVHTRLEHAGGAAALAWLFAVSIYDSLKAAYGTSPRFPSREKLIAILRIAAACHDIGHGAGGHRLEEIGPYRLDHERIGQEIILRELGDPLEEMGIDCRMIAFLVGAGELDGYRPPAWLRACKPVIHGALSCDNGSWVQLDGGRTILGAESARRLGLDVAHTIRSARIVKGRLAFADTVLDRFVRFCTARADLYRNVTFHPEKQAIEATLVRFLEPLLRELDPGTLMSGIERFAPLTDRLVMVQLLGVPRDTPPWLLNPLFKELLLANTLPPAYTFAGPWRVHLGAGERQPGAVALDRDSVARAIRRLLPSALSLAPITVLIDTFSPLSGGARTPRHPGGEPPARFYHPSDGELRTDLPLETLAVSLARGCQRVTVCTTSQARDAVHDAAARVVPALGGVPEKETQLA